MKDSYSQYGEDKIVLDYFRTVYPTSPGHALEIGAGNGIKDSNTRLLWENGWEVVLVEPNAESFAKLLSNYPDRERATLVNAFVASDLGLHEFWSNSNGLATGRHEHVKMHPQLYSGKSYVASIKPFNLRMQFGLFDFISIDAEGLDYDIINDAPVLIRNAKCVCVEYSVMTLNDQENLNRIKGKLEEYGFNFELGRTKGNILMAKQ